MITWRDCPSDCPCGVHTKPISSTLSDLVRQAVYDARDGYVGRHSPQYETLGNDVADLEVRLTVAEKSRNYEASCRAACLIEIDRLTLALTATEKARANTCPFPEHLDGTDGACPAWWRGEKRSATAWKERLNRLKIRLMGIEEDLQAIMSDIPDYLKP